MEILTFLVESWRMMVDPPIPHVVFSNIFSPKFIRRGPWTMKTNGWVHNTWKYILGLCLLLLPRLPQSLICVYTWQASRRVSTAYHVTRVTGKHRGPTRAKHSNFTYRQRWLIELWPHVTESRRQCVKLFCILMGL